MKKVFVFGLLVLFSFGLLASNTDALVRVKGYTTKRGTYVMPSYRTSPNKTKIDNYSTKGNYNPFSGKKGTVNPFKYKW
jgi:hypothetical protein